jgi:hypothetical protein
LTDIIKIIITQWQRLTRTVSVLHTSCVMEVVHQMKYCQFVWHRRTRKCISKTHSGKWSRNKMTDSFQQWTLTALVIKTSLYIDCLKTTDGLAWLYWIATIHKCFNVGCITSRASIISILFSTCLNLLKALFNHIGDDALLLVIV